MKVFGPDPNLNQAKIDEVRNRGKAASDKSGAKSPVSSDSKSSTQVAVSGLAREVGKVSAKVSVTPDIRKEKIGAIKDQVEKGQYHVDGEKIAGKIIEDIINQAKQG